MTDKETAKPFVIEVEIPSVEKAYLYIGAKTKGEAEEAATEILAKNEAYKEAVIVSVEEYQPPETTKVTSH